MRKSSQREREKAFIWLVTKRENPEAPTERRDEGRNGTMNKELLNRAESALRDEDRRTRRNCVTLND